MERWTPDTGYAMAVLMVGIAVMGVMLTVAMPVWRQAMQREKEEELIFRGLQYARAVGLYQRKIGAGYPPNVDFLVQQRFLRKKYKDPMAADGEFLLVPAAAAGQAGRTATGAVGGVAGARSGGQQGSQAVTGVPATGSQSMLVGGFAGVVSKSKDKSIKLYNGRDHYNEWVFVYTAGGGRGVGVSGGRGPGGRGQGQGRGQGGRGPGGRGRQ